MDGPDVGEAAPGRDDRERCSRISAEEEQPGVPLRRIVPLLCRQVAAELPLRRLHGAHARVETMQGPGFDLVVSRAFASLADFTRLTRDRLAEGGVWMAMKGKHPTEELTELPDGVEVFHVEPLVVPGLDAERCLVWMRPAPALEE